MPLYEYGCESCGKVTEMIQKFSDEPLKECPECGAAVQKLMSKTNFQLKGTGWYTTDYKKTPAPSPGPSSPTSDSKVKTAEGNSSTSNATAAAGTTAPVSAAATPTSSG